jgi:putative ABC transport system permease protein
MPLRKAASRLRLALRFAMASVRSNAKRVLLTVLGVAIGIAAVTSMLAIGHSVTAEAGRALARLGGDIVTISIEPPMKAMNTPGAGVPPMSAARMAAQVSQLRGLLQAMPEVHAIASVARLSPCASMMEGSMGSIDLLASTPEMQQVLSLVPARGRFLHRLDDAQGWVVLGAEAARELEQTLPPLKPGSTLELCGRQLRVAGVLARYDGDDLLPMFKVNRAMIVSNAVGERLGSRDMSPQLIVRVREGPQDSAAMLSTRLRQVLGEEFTAEGAQEFMRMKQEQLSLYTRFLAVLGGVALLVGSLGITNVMLVSVSERRAEIGLRVAIGARASDIALQFMAESVLVCLCGALFGVLLGLLGTATALALARIPFSLDLATPLVALLLSLLSGLAAGAYPALRAARLDPVATLQGGG